MSGIFVLPLLIIYLNNYVFPFLFIPLEIQRSYFLLQSDCNRLHNFEFNTKTYSNQRVFYEEGHLKVSCCSTVNLLASIQEMGSTWSGRTGDRAACNTAGQA